MEKYLVEILPKAFIFDVCMCVRAPPSPCFRESCLRKSVPGGCAILSPGVITAYHSGRKYKDCLDLNMKTRRTLYLRPEWNTVLLTVKLYVSTPLLSLMRLAEQTPHASLRAWCKQAMPAWSVKTRCAPSRRGTYGCEGPLPLRLLRPSMIPSTPLPSGFFSLEKILR